MQRLEVSGAVRPLWGSLGFKGLNIRGRNIFRQVELIYSKFQLHALTLYLLTWRIC